jgi:hypothetical protein
VLKVVVSSEPPDETEGKAGEKGEDEAAWDVDCGRVSKNVTRRKDRGKEGAY